MKIGVVVDFVFKHDGGAHRVADGFFRAFFDTVKKSQHHFVVFLSEGNAKHLQFSSNENVEMRFIPIEGIKRKLDVHFEYISAIKRKIFNHRRAFEPIHWLEREALKEGVDFLWFAGPMYAPVRIPYLFTVLDLQHRSSPWFPEFSLGRMWEQYEAKLSRMITRASVVVASSQYVKTQIEKMYDVPAQQIHVVPYSTPRFALESAGIAKDPSFLKKHDLKADIEYLFYPAQFWSFKNHVNLLYALKYLRDRHRLKFHLVLTGSDMGNLSHVQYYSNKLKLNDYVHFLGFVSDEDVIQLYLKAFALTFVSLCGPDNLPSLEALALGCPVIASPEPGVSEQLGDAALVVDPLSPQDIASKIKMLKDDPLLRSEMIKKGFALSKRLTPERYLGRILSCIDRFEPMRRTWAS